MAAQLRGDFHDKKLAHLLSQRDARRESLKQSLVDRSIDVEKKQMLRWCAPAQAHALTHTSAALVVTW